MSYLYNRNEKKATAHTAVANSSIQYGTHSLKEVMDRELNLASKDMIRDAGDIIIHDDDGNTVWDLSRFRFLTEEDCPAEIHPGLWANGLANRKAGLFKVVPGSIYQVRGFDLANLSLVRSETGWIVFDCVTNVETAAACIAFAEETLEEPVRDRIRAIIISHSHLDHYGGVAGVTDTPVPIYVPEDYSLEVVREHIFSGNAMARRKKYQVGSFDAHSGDRDLVSTGIGLTQPRGHASFAAPTHVITEDCRIVIDGLDVEFLLTPETEAPSEMINYIPKYRAIWGAELLNATLHNLYPVRGAQVRDSLAWAGYLTRALVTWPEAEVIFQSHNWHRRNTTEEPQAVQDYLRNTAAAYRYLHDQTLQLANRGFTPEEIGRRLTLPDSLQGCGYLRPFYGTVPFDSRAVYQKYLGFFDCNPVHLHPLEPAEAARHYVRYMGGADAILEKAEVDFADGLYEWVAEVTNRIVFADPSNEKARLLCADAMEQLAWQSESGIWRNCYLTGAKELRFGHLSAANLKKGNRRILEHVSAELLLDYMGILLDANKAAGLHRILTMTVIDGEVSETFRLELCHSVLLSAPVTAPADVTVPISVLRALVCRELDSLQEEISSYIYETLKPLEELLIEKTDPEPFAIVEP